MKTSRLRATLLMSFCLLAGFWAHSPAQEKQGEAARPPQQTSIVSGLEIYWDRGGEVVPGPQVEVDARAKYIRVRARPAKWVSKDGDITDWQIERVAWAIVTVGVDPVEPTEDLDPANSNIILGLPNPGEGVLVHACACLVRGSGADKERAMTRHALLTVRVTGKAPVNGKAGAPAPLETPVAVPAGVTGLSVVVVSREAPPQELTDLVKSERVKSELARSKSEVYLYGPDKFTGPRARNDILAVLKDSQGRDITGAGLVVITSDGKQVLPAGRGQRLVFLRYDGRSDKDSLARNEVIILDAVGRAAGGK